MGGKFVGILADQGFNMSSDFAEQGVVLLMPAMKGHRKQLSQQELYTSRVQSHFRTHVERMMRQIKTFGILAYTQRLAAKNNLEATFRLCALLTNFMSPIIRPVDA